MHARAKYRRLPSKVRQRTSSRRSKGRRVVRRQRGAGAVNAPASLGGFRTLKLQAKAGSFVYSQLKNWFVNEYAVEAIFADLHKCYSAYYRLYYGHDCDLDFVKLAGNYPSGIKLMLDNFQTMAGPNMINVQRHEETGKFYLVIYAETPWDYYWHVFDIKKAVAKLNRKSKAVHDLFLSFIKCLDRVNVDCWFEYTYHHVLDGLMDWYEFEKDDLDPEEVEHMRQTIKTYNTGRPHKYQALICNAPELEPDVIFARANKLKSCPEILELIKMGCGVMSEGKSLNDYLYDPTGDNDGGWGSQLSVLCQVGILWDADDFLTSKIEEWLDSWAQEGHHVPYQAFNVFEDCSELFVPDVWTGRLSTFFKRAVTLIEDFTNE